tara:strand:+ start:2450 stop:3514 length:1065 start_codon:yes stop_codon:yes gene_type:complete
MDDYNSNLLNDSKSEWSIRLMNVLSGHIIDGFRSIFREAMEVCEKNDEAEKYLMTFQNYLSMIPKWNQNMVDAEVERIKKCSKCKYLEDLITCVHILQLKILSCVRTGNQNKKIDIDIPCFEIFLHNVYINIARKLYSNIYLFQIDATPLQQQKHNREFEIIVQTCIMNTIRDNIPVEQLLKQYIDETQEVDVEKTEKVVEEKNVDSDNGENEPRSTETNESNSIPPLVSEPPVVLNPGDDTDIPPSDSAATNESINTSELLTSQELLEDESLQNKSITFEDNAQETSEYDEIDNKLVIGDNVPLVVDEDLNKQAVKNTNEIEEINLDFDSINDETQIIGSEPPIDLGIEELAI